MAKINICFIQFKIHSKNSKNSPLNPNPSQSLDTPISLNTALWYRSGHMCFPCLCFCSGIDSVPSMMVSGGAGHRYPKELTDLERLISLYQPCGWITKFH